MTNLWSKTLSRCRVAGLLVTLIAAIGLAAQNSKPLASSTKSGPDPVKTATRPLAPKSVMPGATQHKSAPVVPNRTTQNTNAELAHLERGQTTAGSKSSSTAKVAPYKSAPSSKPTPKIDYKYQKPAGGKSPSPSVH
jgi:hypothetical protein